MAQRTLPCYAHRFSPHRYTQPQLFACLVLKTFFKTDYRGITTLLREMRELSGLLALKAVPHYTTLQKASRRLLKVPRVDKLLRQTVRRFYRRRRRRVARVAFDSTGMDLGAAQLLAYSRYAKLEAAIDCRTHLLVALLTSRGPHPDVDRFRPLLQATLANVEPERVLADAGYDSEPNHSFAREGCGVRSFMPATHGRPSSKPPTGYHRRRMKQRLNKHYGGYGQRWQMETGFSMVKRRLTSVVHARSYWSQCRELLLIGLTYNLMLIYAAVGFLQSRSDPLKTHKPKVSAPFFPNALSDRKP